LCAVIWTIDSPINWATDDKGDQISVYG